MSMVRKIIYKWRKFSIVAALRRSGLISWRIWSWYRILNI